MFVFISMQSYEKSRAEQNMLAFFFMPRRSNLSKDKKNEGIVKEDN